MNEHSAKVISHFRDRSGTYDNSSSWVVDQNLLSRIFAHAQIAGGETVLDLATGTGLVAKQFHGRTKEVIGLDISRDMSRYGGAWLDRLLIAAVESIPLPDESVDVCVCRQGLQFADLRRATAEIARVLRPGGRAVLCHLTAHGEDDHEDAFRIQALRNPARVNFFKPGDLEAQLVAAGLEIRETVAYLSRESVDRWIDHGASTPEERAEIKAAYRAASPAFKRIHRILEADGDIFDLMSFSIIAAAKPSGQAGSR
jgi:ubiquinone/menaquinone biosynthesis C-methylase UbiE